MEMRRLVCHLEMLKDAYSVLGNALHNQPASRIDWYAKLRGVCKWKWRRQALAGQFDFSLHGHLVLSKRTVCTLLLVFTVWIALLVFSIGFDELTPKMS